MFILLLIFALIRTLYGMPLSSPADAANGFSVLDLRDTQSHFGERAISDIILSCFATIVACTWTAVHPNIPAPTECWWTRFKRQFVTMVYALLVPEAITFWALKQRMAAEKIMNDYNNAIEKDEGTDDEDSSFLDTMFKDSPLPTALKDGEVPPWTLAHGFFLQMGGFMLSKRGRPIQTIFAENSRFSKVNKVVMEQIIEAGIIDRPLITAEDIEDRSKGDAISKTLIIFQTTWFIAQCIARWSTHLPVTELEVVTLGFAMLNGITYFLWWNKPQNVGRPVFLEIKSIEPSMTGPLEFSLMDLYSRVAKNEEAEETPANSKKGYLRRCFCQRGPSGLIKVLFITPIIFIIAFFRPLAKLCDNQDLEIDMKPGDRRVPMFYSGNTTIREPKNTSGTVLSFISLQRTIDYQGCSYCIAVLFGSVHLIPSWFLHFASVQEKWLWRISTIIITAGSAYLSNLVGGAELSRSGPDDPDDDLVFVSTLRLIIGSFYVVSRIILLTISLTSLRSLPPAALQTIKWTTFIPHI